MFYDWKKVRGKWVKMAHCTRRLASGKVVHYERPVALTR